MKKIGLITGVFDLLHPGHLFFIREALQQVDELVVALEPDERVKKLKGEKRPYNCLTTRKKRLQALFPDIKILILESDFSQVQNRRHFFLEHQIDILFLSNTDSNKNLKQKEVDYMKLKTILIKSNFLLSSTKIINDKKLLSYLIFDEDRKFYD